ELYSSQEKMEGEKSSACLMISEYRYLLAFIKKQKTLNKEPEFERMYEGMTEEINKSLTEALSCTPLLLATVLNPAYRLSIFEMCFPDHHAHVKSLIKDSYTKRKSELDELARSRIKSDHQPQRSELRRAHDESHIDNDLLLVDPAEFATLNRPIRNIHNQSSLLQFFH
ncbi:hypothetical protein KEM48_001158, partial [Puccinia striiformis f. sp. tritici PST-130]